MPSHTEEERRKRRAEQVKANAPTKEVTAERQRKGGELQREVERARNRGFTEQQAREQQTARLEGEQQIRIQEQRKAEGVEILEKSGFLDETRPETGDVDLDLPREGLEKLPVFGSRIAALGLLNPEKGKGIGFEVREFLGLGNDEEQFKTIIQDPQTVREVELQMIQQQVLDDGLTSSESLGVFVETIPFFSSSKIKEWVGEIGEQPSDNVNTMIANVGKVAQRATNTREKVLTGKVNREVGLEDLNLMQNDLAFLEQRIKLMSMHSTELQADGDLLNQMEEAIIDAQQRVFDAKESVGLGLITPATDSAVHLELEQIKRERRRGL